MKTYTPEELQEILRKHSLWLDGDPNGERADLTKADLQYANLRNAELHGANLQGANLQSANLQCVDLQDANLQDANLQYANLLCANLQDADLQGANLQCADLLCADLRGANLRDADLDYSVLPLCCGSLDVHFDDRQLRQIAYHLVRAGLQSKNASEETKTALRLLIPFANGFHRVKECGEIKEDAP